VFGMSFDLSKITDKSFEKIDSLLNDEKLKRTETYLNRETARIIKHSFEKLNNIIEANKFYALEMEKRQEELSTDIEKGKNIFEYFIFHIHKFSSEHSTNPLLVLFWILIFSLFYSYCYDFLEKKDFYIECFDEKYLKSWMYDFYNLKEFFDLFLVISIIFGIFLLITFICYQKNIGLMIIFTVCSIAFYIFLTKDFYLFLVAKNFNPFSIMTKGEDLTFSMLIYKSAIAYLIYQFIISIRQNTRRK
jgi:sRNA-binding regulator protein Hfq